MRILVVDIEPLVHDTIAPFLRRCGHEIFAISSIHEQVQEFEDPRQPLDVVIADVRMPDMNVMDLVPTTRARFPGAHTILMSDHAQLHDLRQAIEIGTCGFLRKPIKLEELRLIVEQVESLRLERARTSSLTESLNAERGMRKLITRERMSARRLHQRIFPSDFSWLHHTEVALRHLPQAGLSGDYMDMRPYGLGRALLLMADVHEQGTPAAFGGIALKSWFSSLELGLSPADVLARADEVMGDFFSERCQATAFCALYNEQTRELHYASAGHPSPIVVAPDNRCRVLSATGAALGTVTTENRELANTHLAVDEMLIAYSDGLSDDLSIFSQHLSNFSTRKSAAQIHSLSQILTSTLDLASAAEPHRSFADDISLMALRPRAIDDATIELSLVGKRGLLLWGDATTRLMFSQVLRNLGMSTSSRANAAGAPMAIITEQPDLVILDLLLPDRPGHLVLQDIRQLHPHLPVLVVCAGDLEAAKRQCFDYNPAAVISRPVDPNDLGRLAMDALRFDPDRTLVDFDNLGNEWFDFVILPSRSAIDMLMRYLQAISRQPLPDEVRDDVVWCIREMAMNGIAWGKRFAPSLKVRISTMILADRVLIKITDEGSGFDARRLFQTIDPASLHDLRTPPGKTSKGFGLAAVRAVMTRVEFNHSGTVVLLVRPYNQSSALISTSPQESKT